jgi:hypothetical protein
MIPISTKETTNFRWMPRFFMYPVMLIFLLLSLSPLRPDYPGPTDNRRDSGDQHEPHDDLHTEFDLLLSVSAVPVVIFPSTNLPIPKEGRFHPLA